MSLLSGDKLKVLWLSRNQTKPLNCPSRWPLYLSQWLFVLIISASLQQRDGYPVQQFTNQGHNTYIYVSRQKAQQIKLSLVVTLGDTVLKGLVSLLQGLSIEKEECSYITWFLFLLVFIATLQGIHKQKRASMVVLCQNSYRTLTPNSDFYILNNKAWIDVKSNISRQSINIDGEKLRKTRILLCMKHANIIVVTWFLS